MRKAERLIHSGVYLQLHNMNKHLKLLWEDFSFFIVVIATLVIVIRVLRPTISAVGPWHFRTIRNIRLTQVNQWGPNQNPFAARDWTAWEASTLTVTSTPLGPLFYIEVLEEISLCFFCREWNASGKKGEEKGWQPEPDMELYVDLICCSIYF